jgi:hypothetical protein
MSLKRHLGLPINRQQGRLPHRLPVGARYVVEGFGGDEGALRVIARYVVLPGGRRINVAAEPPAVAVPRAVLQFRRSAGSKPVAAKGRSQTGAKKFAGRRGTA